MTNEEAKVFAKTLTYSEAIYNAMQGKSVPYKKATKYKLNEMAEKIKALETQLNKDCISREQALLSLTGIDLPTDRDKLIALFTERIQHLPPVTPEPCTEDYPTCTECEHYDSEKHYCPRFCQVMKDTVEELKEQNNSQLVIYESDGDADGFPVYDMARCPNCDTLIMDDEANWGEPYCMKCGQALKWEVEHEQDAVGY